MVNEHFVNEIYLTFVNTEILWRKGEWCANAIIKKMKRGMIPEVEYLANTSTVKTIVRETLNYCDKHGYGMTINAETRKAAHHIVAEKILEYVNDNKDMV